MVMLKIITLGCNLSELVFMGSLQVSVLRKIFHLFVNEFTFCVTSVFDDIYWLNFIYPNIIPDISVYKYYMRMAY
jgi:hypothetical protein